MSAILSAAVDDVLEIAAAQAAARLAGYSDDETQAANLPDTGIGRRVRNRAKGHI